MFLRTMTSFIIQMHEHRPLPLEWKTSPDCVFCRIVRGQAPAYKLYENDRVIAILDIMPLRAGHTLVIPKVHVPRVSELPDEFAAACGMAVSKVSRAVAAGTSRNVPLACPLTLRTCTAVEHTGLNVVCNQEYAQAVPHVHYHIIPAPRPGATEPPLRGDHVVKPLTEKEMHRLEYESRNALDENAARSLVESIRARL
ncbi:HIT-like protein [Trametes meyenii]|nr:HIT-like protein [Trametes meyenii]